MRPTCALFAFALLAAGCNSSSSNPLIGTWTTTDGNQCTTKFIFKEKTEYSENPAVPNVMPASNNLVNVTYAADQGHVTVQNTETGRMADWVITDSTHAIRQDPWKNCNYTKQ